MARTPKRTGRKWPPESNDRINALPDSRPTPVGPPCSFCGKQEPDGAKVIPGPQAAICNECIGLCIDIIVLDEGGLSADDAGGAGQTGSGGRGLSCSFCQKTDQDVRKLIAGPSVHICNQCIVIHRDRFVAQGIACG
jgi:hypothetical protein